MALITGRARPGIREAGTASAAAAVVLMAGLMGGCSTPSSSDTSGSLALASVAGPRVVYSVTSDAPITSVTYTDSEGEIATDTNIDDNWTGAARMPTASTEPHLSAVPGPGATTIRCTISQGNTVLVQHTASGHPPAGVSCGATVTAAPPPTGETDTSTGPVVETDIVDPPSPAHH